MAAILFLLLLACCQTISLAATQNYKIKVSAKINGPTADQVWPYIADFCNLYLIFPSDVSFCTEGTDGKPGQIRYSSGKVPSQTEPNVTFVFYTREELIKIDAKQRFLTYQMHENNRGITYLKASMQVLPAANGSTFVWTVVSAPVGSQTYQQNIDGAQGVLNGIVTLIQNLF